MIESLTTPAALPYDTPVNGSVLKSFVTEVDGMPETSMTQEERRIRRRRMAMDVKKSGDLEAVAAKHGVTTAWLRVACKEFQVDITRKKAKAKKKAATGQKSAVASKTLEIIRELQAGRGQAELAKKFKLTKQRISAIKAQAVKAKLLKK